MLLTRATASALAFSNTYGFPESHNASAQANLYAEGRISAVPLPPTLALMGMGLLGLGTMARRRKPS